jgi:hypothetical protein
MRVVVVTGARHDADCPGIVLLGPDRFGSAGRMRILIVARPCNDAGF